jgi:hypothetical protein
MPNGRTHAFIHEASTQNPVRWIRVRYPWLALIVALAVLAMAVSDTSAQSSSAPPTNVLVNSAEDVDTAARPWLARDPARSGRLAIGYNKPSACYLARSGDDGATWDNTAVVGTGGQFPLPVGNRCSRPSIAYGRDGTLYYSFSATTTGQGFPPPSVIFVMASGDGGTTFTAPVRVGEAGDVSDINPHMAVDQTSARLYVVWQANRPAPANVVVSSSGDGGKTFSPAVRPFPKSGGLGVVTVGSDSRVYVGRLQSQDYGESMGAEPIKVEVVTSVDGGQTFGTPVVAMGLRSCFSPGNSCQQNAQGAFTFNPSLSIAPGNSPGQLFLAGSYLGAGDIFRFRFAASTDAGQTWNETGPLGIPAGLETDHQLVPNVAVAPNGRIDIAYYDLAQPSGIEDTYLISSFDGGRSFSTPRKISSAPSPTTGTTGNDTYSVGQLLASSNAAADIAWTDARRGKLDIFFARDPFPVAEPSPTPTPAPTSPPTPGGGTGDRDGARLRPNLLRPVASAAQTGGSSGSAVARLSRSGSRVIVRLRGRMVGNQLRPCGGRIKIGTRAGSRRVATRVGRMGRNCRYTKRYSFPSRRLPARLRPRNRTLIIRILVRYQGNARLKSDLSPPRRVKVRR